MPAGKLTAVLSPSTKGTALAWIEGKPIIAAIATAETIEVRVMNFLQNLGADGLTIFRSRAKLGHESH